MSKKFCLRTFGTPCILGIMELKFNAKQVSSLDPLRRRIAKEWDNLDMDIVSAATDAWLRRFVTVFGGGVDVLNKKYYFAVRKCLHFRLIYDGKPNYRADENCALLNLSLVC